VLLSGRKAEVIHQVDPKGVAIHLVAIKEVGLLSQKTVDHSVCVSISVLVASALRLKCFFVFGVAFVLLVDRVASKFFGRHVEGLGTLRTVSYSGKFSFSHFII
jgi:hypothetical protein